MATGAPQLQQVKQMMKAMWMAGDFGKIAEKNKKEGQAFVARLGLRPGIQVVEVGCGTGNQALPAAHLSARVTAVAIYALGRKWSLQNFFVCAGPGLIAMANWTA